MITQKDKLLFDNMFTGVYVVDLDRKIIYWNNAATQISGYTKNEMIHKHCYNNILKHVDASGKLLCFSGCPLEQSLKNEKTTNSEVFLHHKLGHRLPVTVRSIPTYNIDGVVDGAIELFEDTRDDSLLFEENLKLQAMVVTDKLTKAYNRHFIDFYLNNLIEEATRFDTNFGVLFLDIDHFKHVNDTYGHDMGDEVLKMVSTTMMSNIRSIDRLGRWGGEEFVLIVKLETVKALITLAEKIRMLIQHSEVTTIDHREIKVTISIGGLMYNKKETFESLMKKADTYMYEAKSTGRNKVIIKGE